MIWWVLAVYLCGDPNSVEWIDVDGEYKVALVQDQEAMDLAIESINPLIVRKQFYHDDVICSRKKS